MWSVRIAGNGQDSDQAALRTTVYALTPCGQSLRVLLEAMLAWGEADAAIR